MKNNSEIICLSKDQLCENEFYLLKNKFNFSDKIISEIVIELDKIRSKEIWYNFEVAEVIENYKLILVENN